LYRSFAMPRTEKVATGDFQMGHFQIRILIRTIFTLI
jgi:hypothetical protein